jgi:hypothetical protein
MNLFLIIMTMLTSRVAGMIHKNRGKHKQAASENHIVRYCTQLFNLFKTNKISDRNTDKSINEIKKNATIFKNKYENTESYNLIIKSLSNMNNFKAKKGNLKLFKEDSEKTIKAIKEIAGRLS